MKNQTPAQGQGNTHELTTVSLDGLHYCEGLAFLLKSAQEKAQMFAGMEHLLEKCEGFGHQAVDLLLDGMRDLEEDLKRVMQETQSHLSGDLTEEN